MASENTNKTPVKFTSMIDLMLKFPDDMTARKMYEQIRWSDGRVCPHCGGKHTYELKGGKNFKCGECKSKFTVKTGTIFEDSKIGMHKWFITIYLLAAHKKGVSSHQLAKDIGVTQKTAWFMLHRLRHAVETMNFESPAKGVVELDETYVGGKEKNKHKNKRTPGTQGRSTLKKTAVFGMKSRHQGVLAVVVPDAQRKTLEPIIHENIVPGTIVMTDEHFGFGRAAGIQFSRGCPLTCTFCGQWMFWKKWRHYSAEMLIHHLRTLKEKYQVKIVWFADENFTADRAVLETVLDALIDADLGLSLNINATAADIVRDADIMHLYKKAGIDWVVLGVESVEDAELASIRKESNPYQISCEAMKVLRKHHILSFANLIFGLQDETFGSIMRKTRKIMRMDPDVLNAEYLTPHFWTSDGKATDPSTIIQPDTRFFTYRNQIIQSAKMGPRMLFFSVKLSEFLFGIRPKWLFRMFFGGEKRYTKLLRQSFVRGIRLWAAEIREFVVDTKFVAPGTLSHIPDAPPRKQKVAPKPRKIA